MRPKRLVVEKELGHSPLAARLERRLARVDVQDRIGPADYPSFGSGDLVLARHDGAFVKPCPGTKGYNCCGLRIVHFGLGCTIGCSYCILQEYLDTEALVLFGNLDRAVEEIERILDDPAGPKRFCTGEFTDSLLLEDLTGFGARLVRLFARADARVLELKTKTVHIDGLLDIDHGGRTIISFSVNAPSMARSEEARAAPLDRRIQAAARAVGAGYRVGFHFDPLIRHTGWREGYARVVEDIFSAVPPERVAWISMGAFRYLPRLKPVIRRRHPASTITDEEFVPAADGKMRYLRPRRVEMYRHMLSAIRRAAPDAAVYMCMESPRVWREVFGYDPGTGGLTDMLDRRV